MATPTWLLNGSSCDRPGAGHKYCLLRRMGTRRRVQGIAGGGKDLRCIAGECSEFDMGQVLLT
jgi:hypothetical protein